MRKNIAAGIVASALLIGSAGAAMVLPTLVNAADPTASPTATAGTTTTPATNGFHGFGRADETVSDASVVAKAIGITEVQLNTALQGGQTVAAVAKAHNVDVQVVIDALIADGKTEIAADLKAGTITQAQADTENANLTQRVTDQVNGLMGGPGMGGRGGANETVSDASVVAKALGMTEADLNTALTGGKTIAVVAKDKGVDVQVVIDALVADKKVEIAAEVKSGGETQAQADAELANVVQFATDQVNGTGFGPGGHGGFGGGRGHGHGPDGAPNGATGSGTNG